MLTHVERSARSSRPCTAADMTFEGKCLNCGFGMETTAHLDPLAKYPDEEMNLDDYNAAEAR